MRSLQRCFQRVFINLRRHGSGDSVKEGNAHGVREIAASALEAHSAGAHRGIFMFVIRASGGPTATRADIGRCSNDRGRNE